MTLADLNTLPWQDAFMWFQKTCAAKKWCESMTEMRPYDSIAEVKKAAHFYWQQQHDTDLLEAFFAHPMIGDLSSLRQRFANTKALAQDEQQATSSASDDTLKALQYYNKQYRDKHGFIFIICATGVPAQTMLNELKTRLTNTTETEMTLAAAEQIKITCLRIEKGLSEPKDKI